MEPFRLHLKVGEHEFDAQGDQEAVERQLAVWRELISNLPSPPPKVAPPATVTPPPNGDDFTDYDKIFRQDKRLVSLTVLPRGEQAQADGALLILLGRRHYLSEELVGGSWILDGLEQSGMRNVERVDRVFGPQMEQYVTKSGQHRALRWRLTNLGLARAKEVARDLVATVA